MDINENIYKTNGFRILGIDIAAKNRKIDNRISKIDRYRERKDFSDIEPLKGVFKTPNKDFLLPISPEPSYNDYQKAKNRLYDVESRLVDEIFWFWPKSFDEKIDGEILSYLNENNYEQVISYWSNTSKTASMNMTSIHNLAILYHVRALDGLINGENNDGLFEDLELALNYWSQTIDSSKFKNFVKERVDSLNDPRLTEEFVDQIFKDLPHDLLNINYFLIKKALDSSTTGERRSYVSKLIDCIQNSPFEKSAISKVSSKISQLLKVLINKNQDSFSRSFEAAENDEKYDLLFEYSEEIMPYLSILHDSLSDEQFARNLLNNTCRMLYSKIPSKDVLVILGLLGETRLKKFIDLLKNLKENVTDSDLKSNISTDISFLEEVQHGSESNISPKSPSTILTNDETADIDISVKDKNGNYLSCDVTFTNSETGKKYSHLSSFSGYNTLEDIPCGNYKYKVEKQGYKNYEGSFTVNNNGNNLNVKLNEVKSSTQSSSYNKKFMIYVVAIILASLAGYVITNLL